MMLNSNVTRSKIQLDKFKFSSGVNLAAAPAAFTVYGDLERNHDRIILVGHGFSCNAEPHEWWSKFFEKIELNRYCVICINSLGSPHGALSPISVNPDTQTVYGKNFPNITIEDNANYIGLVLKQMNIREIYCAIGCSLAGFEFLSLLQMNAIKMRRLILAGATSLNVKNQLRHRLQIKMIEDSFLAESERLPFTMMSYIRLMDRLSYTSESALLHFTGALNEKEPPKSIEQYFYEDRIAFMDRFPPLCYRSILQSLVSLDVSDQAINHGFFKSDSSPEILLVGIQDDSYTPAKDVKALQIRLARKGFNATYRYFQTQFGHEAWILDGARFYEYVQDFIKN